MKHAKRMILFALCFSLMLSGCTSNVKDFLNNDEKAVVYENYLDQLPDLVQSDSYYMYELHFIDSFLHYQIYNKDGYKQYAFMGKLKDGFIVELDEKYAYLYLDAFKEPQGEVIRTEVNDEILNLVKKYEIEMNQFLKNIDFVSLEKTNEKSKEQYYIDQVNLRVKYDEKEYTSTVDYYIDENKEVKIHEKLDVLLNAYFEGENQSIDMIVYQNKDQQNEREDIDDREVTNEAFIQTFNAEIEKLM